MKHTKESLIQHLIDFNTKHNKVPSGNDYKRFPDELPHSKTYERHFGTWNAALVAAGLPVYVPTKSALIDIPCPVCERTTTITTRQRYYSIRKKYFCSTTCKDVYMKETKMRKRSRIELFVEQHITHDQPLLFNDRLTIGMELDIFEPTHKIAIELNGPHHYRPIHGELVLSRVQQRDRKRAQLCEQAGIRLHTIDVSRIQTKKQLMQLVNQITELLRG